MESFDKEDWVSILKQKNDIVDVISGYIQLNRKGNNWWGACPFHHEKTPSLSVDADGQYYHCFGCHVSGDVIKFVEEFESVDFLDACKILADKVGYTIPEYNGKSSFKDKKKTRDTLYDILRATAGYYHKQLFTSKEGIIAREYLTQRGIDGNLATKFGLGYSSSIYGLIEFLKLKGYSDQDLILSGVANSKDGRLYDALAMRLIVPIINNMDKVIAFGGRILEKDAKFAKYKNTTNTDIFNKSHALYNINLVKKFGQRTAMDYIIIVEGYMDVIALAKYGIENVVASMGTALTSGQAKMLHRFVDNIYVSYDGDKAGQMATWRSLDILATEGLNVKVIELPEGKDPDDVVTQYGKDEYYRLIEEAKPLTEYKIYTIGKSFNLTQAEDRGKYASECLKILRALQEPTMQEAYLSMVSSKCSIAIEVLRKQLINGEQKIVPSKLTSSTILDIQNNDQIVVDKLYYKSARFVLSSLLNNREYAKYIDISEYLTDDVHIRLFDYITRKIKEKSKPLIGDLFEFLEDCDEIKEIIDIKEKISKKELSEKFYSDAVLQLELKFVEKAINNQLIAYSNIDQQDEKMQLVREVKILTDRQKNIKKVLNNK